MRFPKAYAAIYKDENVRIVSQSGGAFSAISNCVLEDKGIVYGCVMTDSFTAKHVRAEDTAGRDKMRGSKYIQSIMGDAFKMVRRDLEDGKKVLFSGTPCQVAGLRSYLNSIGKEYKNLLCVDIVCHGVPSPKVWKIFLKYIERKYSKKVVEVDFRNKRQFGWHSHRGTCALSDGEYCDTDYFAMMFYGHYALRPACFQCPFKSTDRVGDISIADCWGIEHAVPEMDDDKGVSLILINTEKGEEIFDCVNSCMIYRQVELTEMLQPALTAPGSEPVERATYWKDFYEKDIEYLIDKYCNPGYVMRLKRKVYRAMMKFKRNAKEDKRKRCCGCTACYAVCPNEAISMKEDEEGFLYPHINMDKCIHCKKCLKVCPLANQKGRREDYESGNSYISF